jgi:hypothetical protein
MGKSGRGKYVPSGKAGHARRFTAGLSATFPAKTIVIGYRALASSSANAVLGAFCRFAPEAEPRRGPRERRPALASVPPWGAAAGPRWPACCPSLRSLRERGGCAGLARNSFPSSGALSKRLMIACISSAFGASTKAKPLDSWVSGLRITLMESQTKLSAISHD